MGVVWRAVDVRLERSVAIKQILPQPGVSEAERDNMRQRAMREAKNAARFQHPNAIVVFDIAEYGGDPCLVMEYLAGPSLSAILAAEGTLPLGRVAHIGEQVASALVAAHRAGIVHRDVKPGNILIDEHGTAKITDFGISRAAGDMTLTQTGLIGGTPAYLAPELARGSDPVPSSDVFALGATLYQALEGQTPYGNTTNQLALLYAAANGQINPPQQAGAATALLMSLLRSEPEERPTMAEARDRLAALAAQEPTPPGMAVSPPLYSTGNGTGTGGRQPAAPDTPGHGSERPPWQRVGTSSSPPTPPPAPALPPPPQQRKPPPAPTAAYMPMRSPAAPPNTPPRPAPSAAYIPTANTGGTTPDTKRKAAMFAGVGAAVVVVAVVVFLVLNSGGGKGNTTVAQPPQSSPSVAPPPAASSSKSVVPTPSNIGGKVDRKAAIDLIYNFASGIVINQPLANAWPMLAPDAQQRYGDQAAFTAFWTEHAVNGWSGSRYTNNGQNETDGSVEVQYTIKFKNGDSPETKTVKVVQGPNGPLISGETRAGFGQANQ
ncbi:serine/threonine-protein kinase [Amycolatopsis sp. H20-H5]|uniref:serine/threonine-protein kinase n=1 Tax=Amycolatopsis sp. H20-H5 TaxID=3046309 RepID=UPI003FA361F7